MTPAAAVRAGAALAGHLHVAVLAVTYPDVPRPFSTQDLATALFAPGSPDANSVSQYYAEVSAGLMQIDGEVTPWIVVDSASSYYLPASQYGFANRGRLSEFLASVFAHADSIVDFGRFDNDGPDGIPNSGDDDGVVDMLWILYATKCNGEWRSGYIWPGGALISHVTTSPSASGGFIRTGPGVFIGAQRQAVCAPAYPGVLAHETAHAFGLPDLYDFDFSSPGVGYWDLMAYGLYNTEAFPAYIGAYGRDLLGWITTSDLPASGASVDLAPSEFAHAAGRYGRPWTREYFLLEDRQPLGTDKFLPGGGLLVWHVDPGVYDNNDDSHRMVDLEEADGLASLHTTGGNYGDAGDPFPGSTHNQRFGPYTKPSSALYSGTLSGLSLDRIALGSGASISFTLASTDAALPADSVMAQLLGHRTALTGEESRYLDATGNNNGRLDVGDVAAWLDRMAEPPATAAIRRRMSGARP